jgi:alpha-beta hydrolase superfamily lysophospholipase
MMTNLLDNPLVLSALFYPRAAIRNEKPRDNLYDGAIPVADGVELGYRLHAVPDAKAVVLYFHGNGENAADYDCFAPDYRQSGASLLVVDYRGYGWSTGEPSVSALLADVGPVVEALPGILERAGIVHQAPIVMGRSLGSACAIEAADRYPDQFHGLILESAFAHAIPLLVRLGLPARVLEGLPDPIQNLSKIARIRLPLLVIHGMRDSVIPVDNGQLLYNASPAALKFLELIPAAGHNDLLLYGIDRYFSAIARLIAAV